MASAINGGNYSRLVCTARLSSRGQPNRVEPKVSSGKRFREEGKLSNIGARQKRATGVIPLRAVEVGSAQLGSTGALLEAEGTSGRPPVVGSKTPTRGKAGRGHPRGHVPGEREATRKSHCDLSFGEYS